LFKHRTESKADRKSEASSESAEHFEDKLSYISTQN